MIQWIQKNKIISFILFLGISFVTVAALLKHQRAKHLEAVMMQSQFLQQVSNDAKSKSPLNIVSDKTSRTGDREVALSVKTKAQLEREKKEAQIASLEVKRKIMEVGKKVQREIASAQRHTFKMTEFENQVQDIESRHTTSAGRLNAYVDLRNQIFMSRTTPLAQKRQMLESLDRTIASAPVDADPGLNIQHDQEGNIIMTPKGR